MNIDMSELTLEDATRLLSAARRVLDAAAMGEDGSREQCCLMAQRIVDVIGHSVTDEPPHLLIELDRLRNENAQLRQTLSTPNSVTD